jgi:hypothetical protein
MRDSTSLIVYSILVDWFKSNTIRYFELNECKTIDNSKNCNNYNRHNNINFGQYFHKSHRNRTDIDVNIGIDKQQSRYHQKNNRIDKTFGKNITSNRQGFFINDVRTHYNIINRNVYVPLSRLQVVMKTNIAPEWKARLQCVQNLTDEFLSPMAVQHISADNEGLLQQIRDYIALLNLHIKNVESFSLTTNAIIKSKFIEHGIYPTTTDNYEKEGYYYSGEANTQLNLTWMDFLVSSMDIQAFTRTYNFGGLQFTEDVDNSLVRLGKFIIGKGNHIQRTNIINIFNSTPRNGLILRGLIDLTNSISDLERWAQRIRNIATPISQSITDYQYRTLTNCCPTHDTSIWNFG